MRSRARMSFQAIHARRRGKTNKLLCHVGFGLGAMLISLLAGIFLLLIWGYTSITRDLPSVARIPDLMQPGSGSFLQPTRFYDQSGTHLIFSLDNPGVTPRYIPLGGPQAEKIPQNLATAIQVIVDPNFWQNPGFNWSDLTSDNADTLAQRLVNDLLLEDEPPSLVRNLQQRLLAAQLTAQYGRDKVLEWYLNTAYFGHWAYGIEEAAQLYLGKPASQLDWSGAALLAAVVQAPALNPIDAPEAARQRQREVMDRLLAMGKITSQQYAQTVQSPLQFRSDIVPAANPARAFTTLAMEQLATAVGSSRMERGGLVVRTSLDLDLQQQLLCATKTQLQRLEINTSDVQPVAADTCQAARLLPTLPDLGSAAFSPSLAASAVILDPQTGKVLALIGDTNLADGESDALQAHSGGSLLTPFIYLAGFTQGFGPASLVWDIPASLPASDNQYLNPDGHYHGPVRLRLAMANDYLVPAARMLAEVGADNVWSTASSFGLPVFSDNELPFDGGRLTPLQAAQAYGIFANQGVLAGQIQNEDVLQPNTLLDVTDAQGRSWLKEDVAVTRPIISDTLSYLVNNILSDDTARWPSLGYPNALEIGQPSGAKLGQVTSGGDTWVAGYTPQRVVVVWLGSQSLQEKKQVIDPRLAAGLWHALIQYATRGLDNHGWNTPAGISHVSVCDPSGLLPTTLCPNVVDEVFISGNEPTSSDTLFRKVQIDRETNRLATIFTPPELIDENIYMIVPPEARQWAESSGLPIPPSLYDAIQAMTVLPDVQISQPALFSMVNGIVNIQGTARRADMASYLVQAGQGLNPQDWLQIGSGGAAPVVEGKLASWDTSRQPDGLYALRLVVVHQDKRVDTAVIQVTVDNTPPDVRELYPSPGQVLKMPADGWIIFQVQASDAIGLDRVEFWLDGRILGSQTQAPFSYAWQAVPGGHTLQVKAFDQAGNQRSTDQVQFSVVNQ